MWLPLFVMRLLLLEVGAADAWGCYHKLLLHITHWRLLQPRANLAGGCQCAVWWPLLPPLVVVVAKGPLLLGSTTIGRCCIMLGLLLPGDATTQGHICWRLLMAAAIVGWWWWWWWVCRSCTCYGMGWSMAQTHPPHLGTTFWSWG